MGRDCSDCSEVSVDAWKAVAIEMTVSASLERYDCPAIAGILHQRFSAMFFLAGVCTSHRDFSSSAPLFNLHLDASRRAHITGLYAHQMLH